MFVRVLAPLRLCCCKLLGRFSSTKSIAASRRERHHRSVCCHCWQTEDKEPSSCSKACRRCWLERADKRSPRASASMRSYFPE